MRLLLTTAFAFTFISLVGCQRNAFEYGGRDAPKDAPEYTATSDPAQQE